MTTSCDELRMSTSPRWSKEIPSRLLALTLFLAWGIAFSLAPFHIAVLYVTFYFVPIWSIVRGQWAVAWSVTLWLMLRDVGLSIYRVIWFPYSFNVEQLLSFESLVPAALMLLSAGWAIFGPTGKAAGRPSSSHAGVVVAVLVGPTGLAQALQRRWADAFLLALASQGLCRLANDLRPMFVVTALAVLWLAAIWDAWDTQRKARQEQPAGEGSPSPA
jgi:hypothetical protein